MLDSAGRRLVTQKLLWSCAYVHVNNNVADLGGTSSELDRTWLNGCGKRTGPLIYTTLHVVFRVPLLFKIVDPTPNSAYANFAFVGGDVLRDKT